MRDSNRVRLITAITATLLIAGLALLSLACSETATPNPDPQCQVDDDCGPDYVCENGECEFDWPDPANDADLGHCDLQ